MKQTTILPLKIISRVFYWLCKNTPLRIHLVAQARICGLQMSPWQMAELGPRTRTSSTAVKKVKIRNIWDRVRAGKGAEFGTNISTNRNEIFSNYKYFSSTIEYPISIHFLLLKIVYLVWGFMFYPDNTSLAFCWQFKK